MTGAKCRIARLKEGLEITLNQTEMGKGLAKLNDKFQCLFITRAKDILVTGLQSTGGSTGATVRIVRDKEDEFKEIQEVATISNINKLEPGSSRYAVEDKNPL